MSCERFEERLHDLLDRRLAAGEEAELRLHLAACGRCSQELRELEELLAATRAIPEVDPPAGFADAVMGSVRDEGARVRRSRFRLVSLGALGSLAAGFLLFVMLQPTAERSLSPHSPAAEVSLAKASEKERNSGEARGKRSASSETQARENLAFDKDAASGLGEVAKTQGVAPEANLGLAAQEQADPSRRADKADPAPPLPVVSYYAFVEKPEARGQLLAFLAPLPEGAKARRQESTSLKDETSAEAGQGIAQLSAAAPLTVRYRVSREQLAKLQEQWKKIPGLRVEEVPKAKEAPKSAGAAPAAPKPEASPQEKKVGNDGVYRGPGDSVPSGGGAVSSGKDEMVEIVITFLPPPPASKPK